VVRDVRSSLELIDKGTAMKNMIKSGAFRALLLLGALASSGLVLEAGRRW
jgi:hypothetical protein